MIELTVHGAKMIEAYMLKQVLEKEIERDPGLYGRFKVLHLTIYFFPSDVLTIDPNYWYLQSLLMRGCIVIAMTLEYRSDELGERGEAEMIEVFEKYLFPKIVGVTIKLLGLAGGIWDASLGEITSHDNLVTATIFISICPPSGVIASFTSPNPNGNANGSSVVIGFNGD